MPIEEQYLEALQPRKQGRRPSYQDSLNRRISDPLLDSFYNRRKSNQNGSLETSPRSQSRDTVLNGIERTIQQGEDHYRRLVANAIVNGDLEEVKHVYKHTRVSIIDRKGNTPLHLAAKRGTVTCLRWLLRHSGLPPDIQNEAGESCAHHAVLAFNIKALKVIVYSGGVKPINLVCQKNRNGMTVLHLAAMLGYDAMVAWLADAFGKTLGVVTNKQGQCATHFAAAKGHEKCVNSLCNKLGKHSSNIRDAHGGTPMFYAAQNGHVTCLSALVNHGKGDEWLENEVGVSPLMAAAQAGHIDVVSFIVQRAEDVIVNKQAADGATVYHMAAANGHEKLLRLLLAQPGAYDAVRMLDARGSSPAHDAAQNGHVGCLRLLVEAGLNIHFRDRVGETPQSLAMASTNEQCARFVKSLSGAEPDDRASLMGSVRSLVAADEMSRGVSGALGVYAWNAKDGLKGTSKVGRQNSGKRFKKTKKKWNPSSRMKRSRNPRQHSDTGSQAGKNSLSHGNGSHSNDAHGNGIGEVQGEFQLQDAKSGRFFRNGRFIAPGFHMGSHSGSKVGPTPGSPLGSLKSEGSQGTMLYKQKHRPAPITAPSTEDTDSYHSKLEEEDTDILSKRRRAEAGRRSRERNQYSVHGYLSDSSESSVEPTADYDTDGPLGRRNGRFRSGNPSSLSSATMTTDLNGSDLDTVGIGGTTLTHRRMSSAETTIDYSNYKKPVVLKKSEVEFRPKVVLNTDLIPPPFRTPPDGQLMNQNEGNGTPPVPPPRGKRTGRQPFEQRVTFAPIAEVESSTKTSAASTQTNKHQEPDERGMQSGMKTLLPPTKRFGQNTDFPEQVMNPAEYKMAPIDIVYDNQVPARIDVPPLQPLDTLETSPRDTVYHNHLPGHTDAMPPHHFHPQGGLYDRHPQNDPQFAVYARQLPEHTAGVNHELSSQQGGVYNPQLPAHFAPICEQQYYDTKLPVVQATEYTQGLSYPKVQETASLDAARPGKTYIGTASMGASNQHIPYQEVADRGVSVGETADMYKYRYQIDLQTGDTAQRSPDNAATGYTSHVSESHRQQPHHTDTKGSGHDMGITSPQSGSRPPQSHHTDTKSSGYDSGFTGSASDQIDGQRPGYVEDYLEGVPKAGQRLAAGQDSLPPTLPPRNRAPTPPPPPPLPPPLPPVMQHSVSIAETIAAARARRRSRQQRLPTATVRKPPGKASSRFEKMRALLEDSGIMDPYLDHMMGHGPRMSPEITRAKRARAAKEHEQHHSLSPVGSPLSERRLALETKHQSRDVHQPLSRDGSPQTLPLLPRVTSPHVSSPSRDTSPRAETPSRDMSPASPRERGNKFTYLPADILESAKHHDTNKKRTSVENTNDKYKLRHEGAVPEDVGGQSVSRVKARAPTPPPRQRHERSRFKSPPRAEASQPEMSEDEFLSLNETLNRHLQNPRPLPGLNLQAASRYEMGSEPPSELELFFKKRRQMINEDSGHSKPATILNNIQPRQHQDSRVRSDSSTNPQLATRGSPRPARGQPQATLLPPRKHTRPTEGHVSTANRQRELEAITRLSRLVER